MNEFIAQLFRIFFPDEDRYILLEYNVLQHYILLKVEDMEDGMVEIRQISAEFQGYAASPKQGNFETV